MSDDNKSKYKKYRNAAIVAAVTMAGLGLSARRRKLSKDRKKALDSEDTRSSIVVPLSKKNFLKDLPTPDQYESSVVQTQAATAATPKSTSSESVDDVKKRILRGGRIDFFRKAAEDEDKKDSDQNDKDAAKEIESKEKKDTPDLPRNDLGQFVSSTDPTGVIDPDGDTEKKAFYSPEEFAKSMWNATAHPIRTAKAVWRAKGDSLPVIAGGLGSLYLATLIIDAVNKRRAAKSKANVDEARNEYVKLMQESSGSEKAAQDESGYTAKDNPIVGGSVLAGASLMIPAVLTAIIVNRVLERRGEEKKKAKRAANSFPDEPHILYKTSEAKDMNISPETALAMIFVKEGMMMDAEAVEAEESAGDMSKEAQIKWLGDMWNKAKDLGARGVKSVSDMIDSASRYVGAETGRIGALSKLNDEKYIKDGRFTDEGIKLLGSDEMDQPLHDMADAYINGKVSPAMGIAYKSLGKDALKSLVADSRVYDVLVNKFQNGNRQTWGKLQDAAVEKGLERFGTQGSILRQILAWLYKNTPLGGWMFRQGLKKKMGIQGA